MGAEHHPYQPLTNTNFVPNRLRYSSYARNLLGWAFLPFPRTPKRYEKSGGDHAVKPHGRRTRGKNGWMKRVGTKSVRKESLDRETTLTQQTFAKGRRKKSIPSSLPLRPSANQDANESQICVRV